MSAASPPASQRRWGWDGAVLLLAALASRATTLGNPIVHPDEQFYFVAAHAWLHGALPYVDVWDRKPIGLFLLYAPAAALRDPGAGVVAYQLCAAVAAALTAVLVAALARTAGWGRGALPAALLYLVWLGLADGQGGQAPVFYNLPMALAALLVARGKGRGAGIGAMALVGLAAQVKYSVVFEGAWFGLWLLWRDRRGAGIAGRAAYAAVLVAAAALPTLVAAASYATMGAGAAWWFANVRSILLRQPAPLAEQLGNLATCLALLAVPVGLAAVGWRRSRDRNSPEQRFVHGWLVAAFAGFLAFGTWFDHYTLPVLVPATVAAAAALRETRWRWGIVVVAAVAAQASIARDRLGRGSPAAFAALVEAVGRGPGCLYVHSGPSMLYPFTGRCAVSPYLFPSHLTRARESGAIGVDPAGEVRRIVTRKPAVVVMGQPFRGEAPAIRTLTLRLLADAGYRVTATLPLGRDRLTVYRR